MPNHARKTLSNDADADADPRGEEGVFDESGAAGEAGGGEDTITLKQFIDVAPFTRVTATPISSVRGTRSLLNRLLWGAVAMLPSGRMVEESEESDEYDDLRCCTGAHLMVAAVMSHPLCELAVNFLVLVNAVT